MQLTTIVLFLAALLAPPSSTAPETDADALFQQGRYADAVDAYRERLGDAPDDGVACYRLGFALHALGRLDEAVRFHERAATLPSAFQASAAYNAACAHARLGDVDAGIRWLEQAVALGFSSVDTVDTDPDLDALRGAEGFSVVRAGLATAKYSSTRPFVTGNAHQFDFWVGDWKTENWRPDGTGGWQKADEMFVRVVPILGGRALVEFATAQPGKGGILGFSLRMFDERKDEWWILLNWPSPGRPSFSVLTGRFRHGRGEFFSAVRPGGAGGARQNRFTFSDTGPDRLRWDSAVTVDGGKSWSTDLLFEFSRMPSDAPPHAHGPSTSNAFGPGPEFRTFDFLLGSWAGTRTRADDTEAPVTLRAESILEGAAVTERWSVAGVEPHGSFAVSSYVPGSGAWVRYGVDDRSGRLDRHQARPDDEDLRWIGTPGAGSSGAAYEIAWTVRGPDRLEGERRESGPEGAVIATWSLSRAGD